MLLLIKLVALVVFGILFFTAFWLIVGHFLTIRVKENTAYYIKDKNDNTMMYVQSISKILDFGYEVHVILSNKDGKISERKYMTSLDFSECLPNDNVELIKYASKCTKEQFLGYIRAYITHPYGVDK